MAKARDLPDDVLYELLGFLVVVDPPVHAQRNIGWIRFTFICKHWRTIALSKRSYWAKIVCALPKALDTMIERARGALLSFEHPERLSKQDELDFIHAASDNIRSICSFKLIAHSYSWASLLSGKRLSVLSSLFIQSDEVKSRSASREPFKPFTNALEAPSLRSATFSGGYFLRLAAPALWSLSIERQVVDLDLLRDILTRSPLLELLVLDLTLGIQSTPYFTPRTNAGPSTALPSNLRGLFLAATISVCADVLRQVDLLGDTNITIELDRPADADKLPLIISHIRPNLTNTSYNSLTLASGARGATEITFFLHAACTGMNTSPHAIPEKGIRLRIDSRISDYSDLFDALKPLAVRHLDISRFAARWESIEDTLYDCAGLAGVETVRISLDNHSSVDALLSPSDAPVFPELHTVVLRASRRTDEESARAYVHTLLLERAEVAMPMRIVRQAPSWWDDERHVERAREMGFEVEVETTEVDDEETGDDFQTSFDGHGALGNANPWQFLLEGQQ